LSWAALVVKTGQAHQQCRIVLSSAECVTLNSLFGLVSSRPVMAWLLCQVTADSHHSLGEKRKKEEKILHHLTPDAHPLFRRKTKASKSYGTSCMRKGHLCLWSPFRGHPLQVNCKQEPSACPAYWRGLLGAHCYRHWGLGKAASVNSVFSQCFRVNLSLCSCPALMHA
jgi:hypothetical protein